MTAAALHGTGGGLIPYRPGLDGVRGLAVLAVLAFHGGFTRFAGGFLGVSVFFTLSGFLITSLLVAEHERTGRIDLRAFWARRFRRLLPASLLALGGIGIFGLTVATAEQAERLAGDVAAAVAYLANWRFVLGDTSYAELWGEPSPVVHFWSLAIEEQSYLVLPPLVVATLALSRGRRWPLAAVLGALTAGSVAVSLLIGPANPDRVYFGTDTRAAELLAGALLAVLVAALGTRLRPRAGWWLTAGGAAATAGLGALVVVVDTRTTWLYQGGLPAIALLSAVLILGATRDGVLASALGVRPLRWLGTRSYGIYLYHWPVFLWLGSDRIGLDGLSLFAARLAVTLVAAEASYQLVEAPIRYRRVLQRSMVLVAPQVTAVVLLVGLMATTTAPAPMIQLGQTVDRIPPPPTVVAPAPDAENAPAATASTDAPLVLLGDTMAPAIAEELVAAFERRADQRVLDATSAHCSWYEVVTREAVPACDGLVEAWVAAASAAEAVVVSLGVGGDPHPGRPERDAAELEAALGDLRGRLPADAAVVWVIQPLVLAPGDPPTERLEAADTAWPALAQLSGLMRALADQRGDQVIDLAAYLSVTERNLGRAHTVLDHDNPSLTLGLGWVADQLARPRAVGDAVRLLIVGDSVAYNLGRGFEHHAAAMPELVVWNAGTTGCGIVRAGETPPHEFQPSAVCDLWPDRFESHLDEFDPHLVLVISAGWDLIERRLPDWDGYKGPGDPVFDAYLRDEYTFALDVLSARGAKVVWAISPCVSGRWAQGGAFAADRKEHQVGVLEQLVRTHPVLTLLPLDPLACPDGGFTNSIDRIENFRPDGVHFSDEGARWMAGHLIPGLLELVSPGVDTGATGS